MSEASLEALRIAEEVTARWWDCPDIETREECVASLAQIVQDSLDSRPGQAPREAIVGSRAHWKGGVPLHEHVTRAQEVRSYVRARPGTVIVTGGWWKGDRIEATSGVDNVAALAARDIGSTVCLVAGSPIHGKLAGVIRNPVVVDIAHAVKAFWDGRSPGTRRTMDLAARAGKLIPEPTR